MKNSVWTASAIITTSLLLLSHGALAKPAGCPCSPCSCSPCPCGSGGEGVGEKKGSGKGESKRREGKKERSQGRASVGVGANIDLGGVGQRKPEADPFAVPSESSASRGEPKTATNQTKPRLRSTPSGETSSGNVFTNIKLTGPQAKDVKAEPTAQTVSKP